MQLNNLTFDMMLTITPGEDGVHWSIDDKPKFYLDNYDITMDTEAERKLVEDCKDTLDQAIYNVTLQHFQTDIKNIFEKLNEQVAQETHLPYAFVWPLDGGKLPLNLTMTTAPRLTGDSLLNLQFDGRFVKGQNDTTHYPPNLQPLPADFVDRFETGRQDE